MLILTHLLCLLMSAEISRVWSLIMLAAHYIVVAKSIKDGDPGSVFQVGSAVLHSQVDYMYRYKGCPAMVIQSRGT
jgi:hypothetical protein